MNPIRTLDEFYSAVDALVVDLKGTGRRELSMRLDALMKAAWTTGTELIYALGSELERAAGEPDHARLPVEIRNRIDEIIKTIDGHLGSYKAELKRFDESCRLKEAQEKSDEARVKAAINADLKRRGLIPRD